MGWNRLLLGACAVLAFTASSAQAKLVTVEVGQTPDRFTDSSVAVNQGDTIHWHWDAPGHSVTSGQPPGSADGGFDSGVKQALPATFDQTFNHPGIYHYFCQIHFREGMVGTVTVSGTDPPPSAVFTASTPTPERGETVSFDASTSSTSDADAIDTYTWDFGDGTGAQTTTSPTTTHAFPTAGSHTVKLTITDSGSATASVSHALTVSLPPDTAPTARFSVSPAQIRTGQLVGFNAAASADADGDAIQSYRWTFGDGMTQTSTHPTITHRYAHTGSLSAQLVVVDERGTPSAPATHVLKVRSPAPKLSKLKVGGCVKKSKHCAKPGIHVHFTLSAGAKVTLTLRRQGHKPVVRRKVVSGRTGANSVRLGVHGLRAGRYVLLASPAGGAGVRTAFRTG